MRQAGGVRTSPQPLTVAVGGVVGASTRWAVLTGAGGDHAIAAVLAINVLGSLLLGAMLGRRRSADYWAHHQSLTVGFCGGFTTFSSFAVQTATLLRDGRWASAIGLALASAGLAIAALTAAAAASRRMAR